MINIPKKNSMAVHPAKHRKTTGRFFKTLFSPPFSPRKKHIALIAVVLAFLFIGINMAIYQYGKYVGKRLSDRQAPTLSSSPSPLPINRHGKMKFSIQSKKPGVRFIEGHIDPFDVEEGKTQTLNLYVSNDNPISSMAAVWNTDNKTTLVPMTQKEGKDTEGWWEAVWNADDTIWYKFNISVFSYDAHGQSELELPFRNQKK